VNIRDDYIWHSNSDAAKFIDDYFSKSRNILYIGSIGFDPRTLTIYQCLKESAGNKVTPFFLLEERKEDSANLKDRACKREQSLPDELGFKPNIHRVPIFAEDGASIGGIELIRVARSELPDITDFSDIVIDICAMSRGIFFPLTRYLRDIIRASRKPISLHILVVDQPTVDYSYSPNYYDSAGWMRGFDGGAGQLSKNNKAVKLWMPQLMRRRRTVYETLYKFVNPQDVCPVLPFPGIKAKMVDELVIEYNEHITSTWDTALQNIVLAAESDPLDMYHTVVRVNTARKKIFENSFTILSPMGSKVSTIGGLLAAMDLNLPVAYVETIGYFEDKSLGSRELPNEERLVHVWVDGPIYNSENL
jgi:hypothetical protein